MKKAILFIVVLLLHLNTYSQYIEGTILDATTYKPIEGVHVYVDNVEEGTLSISNGKYFLKMKNAKEIESNINFSHIGYKNIKIPFHKNQREYNVYLEKDVTSLDIIAINQKRNLKQTISFKKLKSMRVGLHSFGSTLVDNKIYIAGGNASFSIDGAKQTLLKFENSDFSQLSFNQFLRQIYSSYKTDIFKGDLLVYDISTNTWNVDKSLFEKRAFHNTNYYNNKLYVLGGIKLSINKKIEYLENTIEVLNLENKTKEVDKTNPHQAANFASFTYQDKLIVLGGSIKQKKNGIKNHSNKVHLFNFKTGYWYQLDSMPTAKETSGVLINDKIYLIGGFNKKPLSEIESYNLTTKKWEIEGNLFYGINNPAICTLKNIIYIYNNGKIYTYNVNSKVLNEYYINLSLQSSTMHVANNTLYLIGGIRVNEFSITPSSSLYSIDLIELNKSQIIRTKTL